VNVLWPCVEDSHGTHSENGKASGFDSDSRCRDEPLVSVAGAG
jgi:hypothetical protein